MPSCIDLLNTTEFRVIIDRMPDINLMAQTFMVPGLSGNPPKQPTGLNPVNRGYNGVTFDQFNLGVILTANLDSYLKVFQWMVGIGFPTTNEEYAKLMQQEGVTSDISVHLIGTNKKAFMEFRFRNAFPVTMSSIQLSTAQAELTPVLCDIAFTYDFIDITPM